MYFSLKYFNNFIMHIKIPTVGFTLLKNYVILFLIKVHYNA